MMHIRRMKKSEAGELSDLWLKVSLKAHNFIPEEYWVNNKSSMAEKYLPNAEVYVAEDKGEILGFVALIDSCIASIFVDSEHQRKGIGSLLLSYAKELHSELTLNVYQKNEKSLNFYKSEGFEILSEAIDEPTGEKEFAMQWNNIINLK